MNKKSKIQTATDFLKKSNLFKAAKYTRLKPLMEKVLDDTVSDRGIERFVDLIAPLGKESESKEEDIEQGQEVETHAQVSIQRKDLRIKLIKEIKSIENVGLIDKIESIKLDPKINIFYGLNASGKSSLYKAICNALGHEKQALANINEDANLSIPKCCLEIEDKESKPREIEWQNGETKPRLNVRIFDLDISLSLVKDDQDNTFSLAHLKQEYFQLLSEFFEDLEVQLNERKKILISKLDLLQQNLQLKVPFLFGEGKELKEEDVKDIKITEEEKSILESSIKEYEELQKVNFDDKIKILKNLIDQIEGILRTLGKKTEAEDKCVWKYIFTYECFGQINDLIRDYQTYKRTLEDKQAIQLKEFVPESWLKNDTWKRFIDGTFEFIKTLSEGAQEKYLEEKCPYCHQKLLEKAKRLIEGYRILQGEVKEKLNGIDKNLGDYSSKFGKCVESLEGVSEKVIEDGITDFLTIHEKTYDRNFVVSLFRKLNNSILSKNELEYSQEDIKKIEDFFNDYLFVHHEFLQKKAEYEEKNKEGNSKKLEANIESLKGKAEINNNKEDLLRHIKLCNMISKIDGTLDLLVDAKTYVSRLRTEFSKKVFIGEFQKYLDKEYENLNFTTKPFKYQLSTRTTHGENKRVYRVGDKRIREILSEGEQNQHALADFFAQSEIENFEGIFVFDDPVTSLDECNMEYLSERLVRLTQERNNQVIVFTHNLVFLNYLLQLTGEEKVKHFTRTSTGIFLDPDAKLGTEHDLKVKRREINDRIKTLNEKTKHRTQINEYEIRSVYDLLSGYLESFVEVRIFKSVISRYRPNIMIRSLNKVEWKDYLVSEVTRLYNKTSRKGSRHSQPVGIQTPTLTELIKDQQDVDNLVSRSK